MASITIRRLAAALVLGTIVALVADALLQNALNLARLGGRQYLPWWVTGNVVERGNGVIAAALLWVVGPRLVSAAAVPGAGSEWSAADTWRLAARLMLALPALWLMASVIGRVVRISLAGDWLIEGPIFLESSFYAALLGTYFPWAAGGLVVASVARHMPEAATRVDAADR